MVERINRNLMKKKPAEKTSINPAKYNELFGTKISITCIPHPEIIKETKRSHCQIFSNIFRNEIPKTTNKNGITMPNRISKNQYNFSAITTLSRKPNNP
jgi:ribonuclease HIII